MLVLDEIDIDVEEGAFVSLLGPSGCGKTTLMNVIAVLVVVEYGVIAPLHERVTHWHPEVESVRMAE